MSTPAKIGCALAGMLLGLGAIGIVGPKTPGHPAVIVGFGGAGAVLGLLVIPRIVAWMRGS